jgi:YesN/AraC family two-component response regulator
MIQAIIVDDEPIIRRTIRKIGLWKENDIEIVGEACNGIEVLQLIKKQQIDLAFIDMKMPGLSGNELLLELSKRNITIMVVVISGYDQFDYALAAIKYGAIAYLLKPIDRNELNATLEKIKKISFTKPNNMSIQTPEKCDLLTQIKLKIDREYTSEISLSSIAREYYISKETLSRAFKKRFGVGVTSYITHARLERAQELLSLGYNSNQISEMIGYNDANYFSRIFKAIYKMTPSEYKISIQKESSFDNSEEDSL